MDVGAAAGASLSLGVTPKSELDGADATSGLNPKRVVVAEAESVALVSKGLGRELPLEANDVEGIEPNSDRVAGAFVVSVGLARLPKSGAPTVDVTGAVETGAKAVDVLRPPIVVVDEPKSDDVGLSLGTLVFFVSGMHGEGTGAADEAKLGNGMGVGATAAGAAALAVSFFAGSGSAGLLPNPKEYVFAAPPENPNETLEFEGVGLKAFAPNTDDVPPFADLYLTCPQQTQESFSALFETIQSGQSQATLFPSSGFASFFPSFGVPQHTHLSPVLLTKQAEQSHFSDWGAAVAAEADGRGAEEGDAVFFVSDTTWGILGLSMARGVFSLAEEAEVLSSSSSSESSSLLLQVITSFSGSAIWAGLSFGRSNVKLRSLRKPLIGAVIFRGTGVGIGSVFSSSSSSSAFVLKTFLDTPSVPFIFETRGSSAILSR